MPHRARQAIPVLTTLDGGLIYPQIGTVKTDPPEYPVGGSLFRNGKEPRVVYRHIDQRSMLIL